MLSYQHIYHAGNLADVHKHVILCDVLHYMIQKPKPLTYMESHSGRGLYDVTSSEALKTNEYKHGIETALSENWFGSEHIFYKMLKDIRQKHGINCYPGSPSIAEYFLRDCDQLYLAELHPQEFQHLSKNITFKNAKIAQKEGLQFALDMIPPPPARGLLLIDPSYEIKSEYVQLPSHIKQIHKSWPTGVQLIWYPILNDQRHLAMTSKLEKMNFPNLTKSEVFFPNIHKSHRLCGSGMIIINTPYTIDDKIAEIEHIFKGVIE